MVDVEYFRGEHATDCGDVISAESLQEVGCVGVVRIGFDLLSDRHFDVVRLLSGFLETETINVRNTRYIPPVLARMKTTDIKQKLKDIVFSIPLFVSCSSKTSPEMRRFLSEVTSSRLVIRFSSRP